MNRRLRERGVVALLATTVAAGPFSPGMAFAEDGAAASRPASDAIYKGLVGKALDAVPMDPEHRAAVQRANAVVSNTMTGRSLSIWAGLANPLLMIGGLIWGIFAASNIQAEAPRDAESAKRDSPPAGDSRTAIAGASGEGLDAVAALAGEGTQDAADAGPAPALSPSFEIAEPESRPVAESPGRERGPDLAANR